MSCRRNSSRGFSALVYLSLILWSTFYCTAAALPFLCGMVFLRGSGRTRFCRFLILYYGRTMIYIAMRPFVRVTLESEAGSAVTEPGIVVFNHRSASDPFLVAALKESVIQLVNGWPMRLPFFGFWARQGGYIDVTLTNREEQLKKMREILGQGSLIVAFPEGTRSGSRKMNQFRSGIFFAARELGCPIYPCCIVGNENFPDRGFVFHRRCVVRIRRLRAIFPAEAAAPDNVYLLKKLVRDRLQAAMDQLEPPDGAGSEKHAVK